MEAEESDVLRGAWDLTTGLRIRRSSTHRSCHWWLRGVICSGWRNLARHGSNFSSTRILRSMSSSSGHSVKGILITGQGVAVSLMRIHVTQQRSRSIGSGYPIQRTMIIGSRGTGGRRRTRSGRRLQARGRERRTCHKGCRSGIASSWRWSRPLFGGTVISRVHWSRAFQCIVVGRNVRWGCTENRIRRRRLEDVCRSTIGAWLILHRRSRNADAGNGTTGVHKDCRWWRSIPSLVRLRWKWQERNSLNITPILLSSSANFPLDIIKVVVAVMKAQKGQITAKNELLWSWHDFRATHFGPCRWNRYLIPCSSRMQTWIWSRYTLSVTGFIQQTLTYICEVKTAYSEWRRWWLQRIFVPRGNQRDWNGRVKSRSQAFKLGLTDAYNMNIYAQWILEN